jgi:hypothetical protein
MSAVRARCEVVDLDQWAVDKSQGHCGAIGCPTPQECRNVTARMTWDSRPRSF